MMGKWMKASELAGIPPMTVVRTGAHWYVTNDWTGEHEGAIMLSGGGYMPRDKVECWVSDVPDVPVVVYPDGRTITLEEYEATVRGVPVRPAGE